MDADTALMHFCMAELRAAGRRVSWRLQRLPASGIYGDDFGRRTLWDELRYEVENGPTELLEGAWEVTLAPIASDVIAKMPDHTKHLLSWHLNSFEEESPHDAIDMSALVQAVCECARQQAGEE